MVAAALLGVGVSTAPKAKAANLYWDSDGAAGNMANDGGGTWSTLNFFNPLSPSADVTSAAADIAYFGSNTGPGGTVNVGGSITIGGLVFAPTLGSNTSGGYTLSASSAQVLTINGSGISLNAGGLATTVGSANLSLTLGAAQTWTNSSSNSLTIGAAGNTITNSTFLATLAAASGGNISLLGNIAGATSGGLTINSSGSGRIIISGTNTQTGTTTLTAGNLRPTTTTALGTGALALNGGVLQLIGGQTYGFGATTVGGNATIWSDNAAAGVGATATLSTLSLGAFTLTNTAGPNVSSGTAGITFGATTLTGAGVINTNNSFFVTGANALTTLGSLTGTFNVGIGGTGNTTITGAVTTSTGTITKNGTGILTLSGANTTTGLLTINGGSVVISAGGTLGAQALTFGASATGGGLFNFNSASTASALTQTLGALSFLGGEGVVQSTYTAGATSTTLTFASLAARTLGASGLFVSSGGTNGTTNLIKFTTFTTPGSFIGGAAAGVNTATGAAYFFNAGGASDYAWYDTTGFVRAPVYGTDAGSATVAAAATTLTAANVNQITTTSGTTGTVTQGATVAVNGIKFTGAATALSISSTFTVTTPSILVTGGTVGTPNAATISGAGTLLGLASSDIIIRTDTAYDTLNVSAIIGNATATSLTKTGAGTLNLTGANTFTGGIYVNQGVLTFSTNYSTSDTTGVLGSGGKNITLNGGTLKNVSGATFNPTATGLKVVFASAGARLT